MSPRTVYGDGDEVYFDHDGVLRETDRAKLYRLADREVWIPKSVITDEGDDLVGVKRWFAEKEKLA